jgi:hypothetical protein
MEIYNFIVAVMTFAATIILGVLNYRLNSQTKKFEKLKNSFSAILYNTLGFIELENNIGGINRADVTDFLIKQAEKQTELRKYIAISEK